MQSLGRLVSLRDYETEVLTFSGVTAVTAAWGLHANGVPSVLLRVLMEAGREAEFETVRDQIALAQICRGPNRFPAVVQEAFFRYVFLDLQYSYDPALLSEDVEAAIRASLGLVSDDSNARTGLFGLRRRRLGEKEYASRVEATVQNVSGVKWCKVTAFGRLYGGFFGDVTDPVTTLVPAAPRVFHAKLSCPPRRLLQLHANHLTLTSVANPHTDPCA